MEKIFKINKTHIAAVRCTNESQMAEVCRLLQWDEDKYCRHQFSEYQKFVNALAVRFPDMRTWIEYSAKFRGFWNNEWSMRNRQHFLPVAYDFDAEFEHNMVLKEYLLVHNHMRLINADEPFFAGFENLLKLI